MDKPAVIVTEWKVCNRTGKGRLRRGRSCSEVMACSEGRDMKVLEPLASRRTIHAELVTVEKICVLNGC